MAMLEELTSTLQTVADRVGPAVVGIGHRRGAGSGFVVADGRVATNAHNVRGDVVQVRLHDGSRREGTVAAADPDSDLAVVHVDTGGIAAVEWHADGRPGLGTGVFALSLARSGAATRVTFGTVAAVDRGFRGPRNRPISGAFEHTAPLARGASGGPVVDAAGALLGINTHRLGEGFYLAVPADQTLRDRIDALAAGEAPSQRRLGVVLAPPHVARRLRAAVGLPERNGVLVQQVFDDTPAAAAGVRRGDLVVAIDGADVDSVDVLYTALSRQGDAMTLRILRGTDEIDVTVTFS
ncbi:MAG: S1C family serine protease [Actinobacteria bacterium]|nr:S1C family serine protease [Actinomycetota bacterium]